MAEIPFAQYLDNPDENDPFALLKPVGPYNFKIVFTKADVSGNGNEMIKIRVVVTDGPNAGKEIYTSLTLTDDTPSRFTDQIIAAGVTGAELRQYTLMSQLAEVLLNKFFTADVQHREFPVGSGQMRNNFGFWQKFSGQLPAAAGGTPDVQAAVVPASATEQAVAPPPVAPTQQAAVSPPAAPAPAPPAPAAAPAPAPAQAPPEEDTALDGPPAAQAPPF